MKGFFKQDSVFLGLLLTLGSELLTAALLWAGLYIAGEPIETHMRWFAVSFVIPIFILRYFARKKSHPVVTKTIIISIFVSFVAFMFLLFKTNSISL